MKVRVHQVAKDLNRPTKDVLAALEKLGVEGKHHTSSIEEELIPRIKKELQGGDGKGAPSAVAHHKKEPAVAHPHAPAAAPKKAASHVPHAPRKSVREKTSHQETPSAAATAVATKPEVVVSPAAPAISEEELERLTAPVAEPAPAPAAPPPA